VTGGGLFREDVPMSESTATVFSYTIPHGGSTLGFYPKATAQAISKMGAKPILHTAQVVTADQLDDAGFWSPSVFNEYPPGSPDLP
jgi:hypothetical protein